MIKLVIALGGVALLAALAALAWLYRAGFVDVSLASPYVRTASAALPPQAPSVAFVDVHVIPMDRERVLERQSVIVRDGRVLEVGPVDAVRVPADALVVDGRGRYLMPGLVDMHVHVEEENELLLFVANGVTTVRNMWGNRGPKRLLGLPDQLELRERIRRGELLGPTIVTSGPILEGRPASNPFMTIVSSPAQARREVARQAEQGYDFVKVYDNLDPEVFRAILGAAREHGLPVAGHVPSRVGLDAALAGGLVTIEHLSGYVDHDAATRIIGQDSLDEYARRTRDAGTWNTPTFVIWQMRTPSGSDLTRPELRFVSPRMQRIWRTFSRTMVASITYDGDDYRGRVLELMTDVVASLRAAGARILLGTDTDNAYVIPGFSIHEELGYLVAAGLSPYEALRAGTAEAAEALGATSEFGTISPGMRADLLLLDANPLDDVGNAGRRAGVMLRGRWLPEADLLAMLEGLAASYGRGASAAR